jgi:hypothetical protein
MMWCLGHFGHWEIRKLISYLNYSAISSSLIVYLTKNKIFNLYISVISLTPTLFYLLFIRDTGSDLYHHGAYNRLFFIPSFFLYYLINALLFYILRKLFCNFKKTVSSLFLCFLIIFLIFKYITYGTCEYWLYGFKGTKIDNDNLNCVVPTPEICSFKIFDNILDMPRFTGANCSDHTQYYYTKDTVLPYSNLKDSNTEYFGYPRTEKWDMVLNTSYGIFQPHVLKNLVDMEDPNITDEVKNNVEFTLDFRNTNKTNKFNAELKLKKNFTLEKEMIKRREEFNETVPMFNNVLVIFIDSLSRNHFRRKLPKTFEYLEKKYDNSNNEDEISSYQFLKFSSLYPGTLANMAVMYYGNYPHNPSTSVLTYLKNAGFVLGSSMNYCGRETIDVEGEISFKEQQHDHELAGLFCDPNLHSLQGPFTFLNGPYSITKKCLWGKESVDWSIDYAKQFFTAYKNNSKFFRLSIIDSHEASGEMIKYDDDKLFDFLTWYEQEEFMKDSLVMIMADHGFFMPGWIYEYFNFKDYEIEMTLPALFMLIPKSNPYYKYLNYFSRMNEQSLLTTFDLHKCLESIVRSTNEGWGICPFLGVQNTTSCEYWSISNEWCRCFNHTKSK